MIAKTKINKLIDVSNNRCGIDTDYVTRSGEKGTIVGSKKVSVVERVQEWFETGEMESATIISIHGSDTFIDFAKGTINGVEVTK